jgi:hypothetical protein
MKLTKILLEVLLEAGRKRLLSKKFFIYANASLPSDSNIKSLLDKATDKKSSEEEKKSAKKDLYEAAAESFIRKVYNYFFYGSPSDPIISNVSIEAASEDVLPGTVLIKNKSSDKESIFGYITFDLRTPSRGPKAVYAIPEMTILKYNSPDSEVPLIFWNKGDEDIYSVDSKKYDVKVQKTASGKNVRKGIEKQAKPLTKYAGAGMFRPEPGGKILKYFITLTKRAEKEVFDNIFTPVLKKYTKEVTGQKPSNVEYIKQIAETIMNDIKTTAFNKGFISENNSEADVKVELVGKPGDEVTNSQRVDVILGEVGIIKLTVYINVNNYKLNLFNTKIQMNTVDVYGSDD